MSGISRDQHKIKVDSSGEVTINLNLTITLNGDNLSITAETPEQQAKKLMKKSLLEPDEEVDLVVPDIDIGDIIDFGKKV